MSNAAPRRGASLPILVRDVDAQALESNRMKGTSRILAMRGRPTDPVAKAIDDGSDHGDLEDPRDNLLVFVLVFLLVLVAWLATS